MGAAATACNARWWRLADECSVDAVAAAADVVFCVVVACSALVCRRPSRDGRGATARFLLLLLLLLVHGAELGDALLSATATGAWGGAGAAALAAAAAGAATVGAAAARRPTPVIAWLLPAAGRALRAAGLLGALGPVGAAGALGAQHVRLCCAVAAAVLRMVLAAPRLRSFSPRRRRHLEATEESSAGAREAEMEEAREEAEREEAAEGGAYLHESAGPASRATFAWLLPLLRTGARRPLELEDLGAPPAALRASAAHRALLAALRTRQDTSWRRVSLWRCYFRTCWKMFFLGGLFKLLGDLVGFVAPIGISLIIEYITEPPGTTTELPYYSTWHSFIHNGYIMAVIIFVSSVAQGTFSQSSTHLVNVEGIRLKSALQTLVYGKALRLCVWTFSGNKEENEECKTQERVSLTKHKEQTNLNDIGAISNLMSEDVFNVMTFFWIGHYIWAIPLKIALLMYLLYTKLGISAVIGSSFCIIIMTPLQFVIGKYMSKISKNLSETTDERLGQVSELLQGIQLLKLYCWEDARSSRILKTRSKELKLLNKDSICWALMTFLTHASSTLITLITFGTYSLLDSPSFSTLSAGDIFSGLALFNQLTVPLFIFPVIVPVIINAMVSTRRLEEFLEMPETFNYEIEDSFGKSISQVSDAKPTKNQKNGAMKGTNVSAQNEYETNGDGVFEYQEHERESNFHSEGSPERKLDNAVCMINGTFSWNNADDKFSLKLDSVTIPKGKLTLVVGRVGGGKSSFLASLLGETHVSQGNVTWARDVSIAYAAQKPWLLNASVRNNILFGQPFHPHRYEKVIAACVLQPDIDILPERDLTEVGDKGISLSGGQKQRIAIARTLYSKANCIILDDPLSALDHQVGQQVFDDGIRKLLLHRKRTVILVTHQLHLVSQAHKIIAIENGQIRAQGSLAEIESVDPVLVREWKETMTSDLVDSRSPNQSPHTAKERWQLVKFISRLGIQFKQRLTRHRSWQNAETAGIQHFSSFRRRFQTFSGSRHLTHDLPLPIDECEDTFDTFSDERKYSFSSNQESTSSSSNQGPLHKGIQRVSSLQIERKPFPVSRQYSSPSMNIDELSSGSRSHIPMIDGSQQSFLQRIFSVKNKRSGSLAGTGTLTRMRDTFFLKKFTSTNPSGAISEHELTQLPGKRHMSNASALSDETNDDEINDCDNLYRIEQKFIWEEREYGKIQKRIYISYLLAGGIASGLACLLFTLGWQGLRVYTDYWLGEWSTKADEHNFVKNEAQYYISVYTALSAGSVLLSFLSNGIGQYFGAKARKNLHEKMLTNILHCPMRFFETTPFGRIINRFSTDMSVVDKKIATSIQRLLQFLLLCASAIFVNGIVTPWLLILAAPICVIYYMLQRFYRFSSRELQRLDGITRSPVLSHFTETLDGLTSIRAFHQQQRFTDELMHYVDVHTNVFLILNASNRWLGIALDCLGAAIVFVAIIASLVTSSFSPDVTPSHVGLAINYTLLLPIYLNWVVKFLADMEMYMSAVERIQQYTLTPTEEYYSQGSEVADTWPQYGNILFEHVSLGYGPKENSVITNLNLNIPAGQKIGICGRTGCGKSSLVMSLFRMVDIYEGVISIDGVDITKVPLQTLRSRLSVIPQDVVMFSGSVRDNLDPLRQHTDEEIWRVLEVAQLKEIVSSYSGKLDEEIEDGGQNLSAGERQLFSLARALLHNAACLIMDEATSSVDPSTEKALLSAATEAFANRTVITIAHRLSTILNCDRIIVLDKGQIVEDGPPDQLLNKSMGIFSSMLRHSEN